MRTAIRALAITAAAALTVSGLAACSSGSSGDSGDSKTLTYWASNQGTSLQNDKEVLTPVLKKFTKETGIKVDLQVIGWNDLQNKIQTAVTRARARTSSTSATPGRPRSRPPAPSRSSVTPR